MKHTLVILSLLLTTLASAKERVQTFSTNIRPPLVLFAIYTAQKSFHAEQGRYSEILSEVGVELEEGAEAEIYTDSDQSSFLATIAFQNGEEWSIDHNKNVNHIAKNH